MTEIVFMPDDPRGPVGRLLRLKRNLPRILQDNPGNMVEVGAGYGESTKILLDMADSFNRKVLVIDPWGGHDGVEQHDKDNPGYAYTYKRFMDNVGGRERLKVCRAASNSDEALLAFRSIEQCAFVMLDGDMSFDGMSEDLLNAAKFGAAIICVDDYNLRSSVKLAADEFASTQKGFKIFASETSHEAYICRV